MSNAKGKATWGVWCIRSGASMFGAAEGWLKSFPAENQEVRAEFDTEAQAQAAADRWNRLAKGAVSYYAKPLT